MNRSGGEADAQKVVAENIAYFNTTRTAECGLNLFRHRNLHQLRRRAEFTNAFANLPRRTHADAQLRAGLQISCRLKLRADDYLVLIAGRLAKIIQLRPFRVRQLHALGQRPVQLGGNMVASVFGGPMCRPRAKGHRLEVHHRAADFFCALDGDDLRAGFGDFYAADGERGVAVPTPRSQRKLLREPGFTTSC